MMGEFRFPPLDGPIVYTESRRLAFRALFEVATNCFSGLFDSSNSGGNSRELELDADATISIRPFAEALRQVRDSGDGDDNTFRLFQSENEPFQTAAGQPFSQSFFNLFNYDHGSLNSHVDRSLLTVIYSTTAQDDLSRASSLNNPPRLENASRRSALWVKDNQGMWHDADRIVTPDQAIVMVGEDLETAAGGSIASTLGLYAAEHSVRVDPLGLRIERSHFRRDPSCAEGVRNRLSAAMILRHEPE